MGLLRFILATLVLVSHLSIGVFGYNVGVASVVLFYVLAGQVVVRLWAKMSQRPGALYFFARDRLLRIFPQYLVAMTLAGLIWLYDPAAGSFDANPSAADWLFNLTIIPLNFYMYNGVDEFILIPPAWSLGAELQFYLLAPLLFGLRGRAQWVTFAASFLIFLLAQMQLLNSDHYGYRLLPGVLFIFLLGACLAPQSALYAGRRRLLILWGALAGYLLWLAITQDRVPFRLEVALGLVVGLPVIVLLQSRPAQVGWLKLLNRRAGELSYGIFLFHFPAIWVLQLAGQSHAGIAAFPMVMLFSLLLAAVGHWLVERPVWHYFRPRLLG